MKAVFLDRDGVINKGDKDYIVDWAKCEFIPDSIEAIRLLAETDYRIFIVTNQSGIEKGVFTHRELGKLHSEMKEIIEHYGGRIDGIYYCPHYSAQNCWCRKPEPGMLLKAAEDHDINLDESWMVGDWWHDMGAGKAAGCKTILVRTGDNFKRAIYRCGEKDIKPTYIVRNLLSAVNKIIKADAVA